MAAKLKKYVRIRYLPRRNQPKHMLESCQNFRSSTTGAAYKVRLDMEESTFQVINVGQRRVIKSGGKKGLTHHWLKILAKRALESLGVQFGMDLRNIDRTSKKASEEPENEDSISDCNLEVNN